MAKRKKYRHPELRFGEGGFNPEQEDLEDYLDTHDGRAAFPLFRGVDIFHVMREKGWLAPRYTIVRLMWNFGREDEHFFVTEDFQLQGIEAAHHGGREGIHSPEEILGKSGVGWEIQHLRRSIRKFL